jgi:hypothetical protein
LRQSVLLIEDKKASGATVEDAETIANYQSHYGRNLVEYKELVQGATA